MNYNMKKIYENPMLQIVSIKRTDIVTASETMYIGSSFDGTHTILAPGRDRNFNSWYEGD